jgi:hypothetical protein
MRKEERLMNLDLKIQKLQEKPMQKQKPSKKKKRRK